MRKTFGHLQERGLVIQPDRTIEESNDFSLRGSVEYEVTLANQALLPGIHSFHPDNPALLMHSYSRKKTRSGVIKQSSQYIGIESDPTPYIVQWPGNNSREPLETHPDFETELAGTNGAALNGALFESTTGEFQGFFDPEVKDLYGSRSYITPSPILNLSWWTYKLPDTSNEGKILTKLPKGVKVKGSENIKDWLILGIPYREVGFLYNVTMQLMGSGPNGWSQKIYDVVS